MSPGDYDGWLNAVKTLTQILPDAVRSGEAASHFFKLYSALVEPPHVKVRLVLKGFFPFICRLILRETQVSTLLVPVNSSSPSPALK